MRSLFLEGRSDEVTERLSAAHGAGRGSARVRARGAAIAISSRSSRRAVATARRRARAATSTRSALAEDHGDPVRRDHVRARRPHARQPQLLSEASRRADRTTDEIIRAFLLQYYGGRDAPKEILVSRAVPEAAALGSCSPTQSGHKVRDQVRACAATARGSSRWRVTNARHGAELPLSSERVVRGQLECARRGARSAARRRAGIECFDISHTAGEATVASCVVFGTAGAAEVRLPALQHRRHRARRRLRRDGAGARRGATRASSRARCRCPTCCSSTAARASSRRRCACSRSSRSRICAWSASRRGPTASRARESLYLPEREAPLHLAAQLAGTAPDPADARRGAPLRDHRASRAASEGAHALAARGDPRARSEASRRDLLRQFGGLQALTRAGVDDLMRVKGISRQLAESIYERFHAD